MRTKKGFNKRTVCGEQIIVAEGKENIDFSNIISMNETAGFLWDNVVNKDFTAEDLKQLLTDNYDVDDATAAADAAEIAQKWLAAGIVDE